MSTIEKFRSDTDKLLSDIDEYERSKNLKNPYTILSDLSAVIGTAGKLLTPTLGFIGKVFEFGSKAIDAYIKHKTKKGK